VQIVRSLATIENSGNPGKPESAVRRGQECKSTV
jgi:hypothetical protein